ncbi:hypothetical protein MFLO_12801 [Listeria floridensis FSL S10-1187]|uniref:Tyrosine specific protein phosphatases domain-containing protein n=1 Tax=Listeria floridensis FSL S10-1187 TaxID=1265817 RepID=A0ABN0RCX3_9LIST|nr:dual specificity protein phosphatase family protein [Listeria floridensis]EUJ28041.1 hypothetical protein MFLO_12801 [Listeria floridensis FSL S10-1187]
MANYINKEKREIDFDPFSLPIIALPEVMAVIFQPKTDHALLIRITDQNKEFMALKHPEYYQAVLEIHFNDINETDDYWGLSQKEKEEMKLFNERHAEIIFNFIDQNPDHGQIVVHCDAGISRSSAVAMGLAEHYGDFDTLAKLREVKRYLPNPRVRAVMRGERYLPTNS